MQNLNVLIISAPLYAASNNIWFLEAEKSKYKIILVWKVKGLNELITAYCQKSMKFTMHLTWKHLYFNQGQVMHKTVKKPDNSNIK